MSQVVLIDGENLIHKVLHVLEEAEEITDRDQILSFNIKALLEAVLGSHLASDAVINYYSTKVHQVDEPEYLAKKTADMISWNSRWVPFLNNLGITYIKAGNLQVRDSKKCHYCGKHTHTLQEKGVDVRLAVDLLLAAEAGSEVILVSSDSDIIPAVNAAKLKKADISYVGFDFLNNDALSVASDRTFTINSEKVINIYKAGKQ